MFDDFTDIFRGEEEREKKSQYEIFSIAFLLGKVICISFFFLLNELVAKSIFLFLSSTNSWKR